MDDDNVGIPPMTEIEMLRLEFGDTDEYDELLSDQSYQAYLNLYTDKPSALRKAIVNAIMSKLARTGFRQRVGQEEAYLGERYQNYLDWLKQKASNPLLGGNAPNVYVGGVVREEVARLENDPYYMDSTFYRGQQARTPYWNNKRYAGIKHTKEVEEDNTLTQIRE